MSEKFAELASAALNAADAYCGATAPNPPVGSAAMAADGRILAAAGHERAGRAHAEAALLQKLEGERRISEVHTVLVTLEPCNHLGRTPPCTEALIRAGVKRVVYLAPDPNPVASGGAERLRQAGIEVIGPARVLPLLSGESRLRLRHQLGPFLKRIQTGMPWLTVKRAFDAGGSMIPPAGQKTFSSEAALTFAHALRRRSDAILTGSGTILADQPLFTVRRVPDHAGKIRALWIADRRGRISEEYLHAALSRGFMAERVEDWRKALREGGRMGALEVLVEAGPALSDEVLSSNLWDRCVDIYPDRIEDRMRETT